MGDDGRKGQQKKGVKEWKNKFDNKVFNGSQ
jgi:hypothetical protein